MALPHRLQRHLQRRGVLTSIIGARSKTLRRSSNRKRQGVRLRNEEASATGLLTLPAEVRNRVYEYALLEDAPILVTDTLCQPALTRACGQLRSETLRSWYSENQFNIGIADFDGSIATKWELHCQNLSIKGCLVRVRYHVTGLAHLGHLVERLRLRWEHRLPTPSWNAAGGDGRVKFYVAVHTTLDLFLDRPWSEFEAVLEDMRALVTAYDTTWDFE